MQDRERRQGSSTISLVFMCQTNPLLLTQTFHRFDPLGKLATIQIVVILELIDTQDISSCSHTHPTPYTKQARQDEHTTTNALVRVGKRSGYGCVGRQTYRMLDLDDATTRVDISSSLGNRTARQWDSSHHSIRNRIRDGTSVSAMKRVNRSRSKYAIDEGTASATVTI